ncbi:hypothetical protein TRVA0_002S03290 [Trichomonascus vanleenenianus]|uniref:uncharacterized protein n=1 Tax=Trichomonascus vanleenenianus TaxID=2268995 RepID=UPI003ECA43F6
MSGIAPALLAVCVAAIGLSSLAVVTGIVAMIVIIKRRKNTPMLPVAEPPFQLAVGSTQNADIRVSQEIYLPPATSKCGDEIPQSPDYRFSQFTGQYTVASSSCSTFTLGRDEESLQQPHAPFRDIKLIPAGGRNSSSCFTWSETHFSDTSSLTTFPLDDEQQGLEEFTFEKSKHDDNAPFNIFKKKQLSPIRLMTDEEQFPSSVPLSKRRRLTPLDFTRPSPRFVKVDMPLQDGMVFDFSDPTTNDVVSSLLDTSTPPSSPGSDPFATMHYESPTPLPRSARNRKNLEIDLIKSDIGRLVRYGDDGILILSKGTQSPIITSPISPIPSAHRSERGDRYDLMLDFLGGYE